ncbi:MAG: type II toxin-antitoxin system RelE/ParE family toxin [Oscillospiraceae bacterium]|nr:type II toxin-antitoxin system RelE/ParE family toxin [Oscillospiraceae bacterium]
MNYDITIDKTALKFINKQPSNEKKRILSAIYRLPEGDVIKMSGKYNLNRLRVGSYRIIFSVEDEKLLIRIVDAGNRGDVYK